MGSIPQTSGIYQILCVPTGKVYIGSAVNLRRRWMEHRKYLRGGRHGNPYLQRAWDKYGESSFAFSVLALVPADLLLETEQQWIDATRCCSPDFGYNIAPTAGSNLGRVFPPEYGQAISERNSDAWEGFIDPNGSNVTITGLWGFCKRMGLHFGAMWNLARGKGRNKSYKGWTHRDNPSKGRFVGTYEGFIDSQGNPVPPIVNMAAFCREHGLHPSHMREVYHGQLRSYKGWTCVRDDDG